MKNIFFTLLIFTTIPAFAGLELRYNSSSLTGDFAAFDRALDASVTNTPDFDTAAKITGGDLRYAFPFIPVIVGVRYEKWSNSVSGTGTAAGNTAEITNKFEGTRTSVLGGYRFISLPIFSLGFLAHYAMSSKMEAERSSVYGSTTRVNKYTGNMDPSFGAGIDAAVYFWKFLVSAEVGYTVLKASSITESDKAYLPSSVETTSWDYSGTYTNLSVGLFF